MMTCSSCAALMAENEALMERYQIVEAGRYAAERQVRYLKGQLHGSTTPETAKVREVCDYHDELWHRTFPKARGLKYPMDGKNAAAVRKVLRWGFEVEEIKKVLDGAFGSEFHRSKPTYLYLASILGDENKIRSHLERGDEKPARTVPYVDPDAADLPSEARLAEWADALQANQKLLLRTLHVKGWSPGTLEELQVGFDGYRLVLPMRNADGELVNTARYLPNGTPKMMALKGRPRELFPAPETITGTELWLVEGEPDAITAHQLGLPAVGVPGAATWHDDWIPRLASSRVVICFDCDEAGRKAAGRVRAEVESVPYPTDVRVVDLDPSRSDGFDLSDFVLAGGTADQLRALAEGEATAQLGLAA